MVAKKVIAPDVLSEARRLYEQTAVPVSDIADMMGLSRTALYNRLPKLGWTIRRDRTATIPERAEGEAALSPAGAVMMDAEAAAQQRVIVAQRLMAIVEREMDAIERIVAVLRPSDSREAEHSARTLASVSRTMRDIALLAKPADEAPTDDDNRDTVPRNIDEFRIALAARIEAIIESRPAGAGQGSGSS